MNRLLTLLAAVVSIGTSAQTVQTEYFVDTDPGLGKAIRLAVPTDAEGNGMLQFTIPKDQLPSGRHLIGVRTLMIDENNVTRYSPTETEIINILQPQDRKPFMYVEYFWDTDSGYDNGKHIALPAEMEATLDKLPIPTDGLKPGKHRLGVRVRGCEGWTPTVMEEVDIWPLEQFGFVSKMEYFWDEDPGFGQATMVTLPTTDEANLEKMHISTTELTPGLHRLGVRFNGGLGWSPTVVEDVVVLSPEDFGKILKMEYFWDVDPGYGNGKLLEFEAGPEVTLDNVTIPMPDDGQEHKLGLRGFGNNKWGPTFIYDTSTPQRRLNDDDLTALRALYNATGGAQWSGSKWTPELSEIRADNWSGVSFNSDDRVSAIDLKARNLTGNLQEALPALTEMTSMNLSQNALKGDPAAFLSNNQQLTELDLSYNQFDELSGPLSLNLSEKLLNLKYQHRKFKDTYNWPGLNDLDGSVLNVGNRMDVVLPSIVGYDHAKQKMNSHPKLNVYSQSDNSNVGTLNWQESSGAYAFTSSQTVLDIDDESSILLQPTYTATLAYSAYPGTIRFTLGDANMNGIVDVDDVQRTLYYIIKPSYTSTSIGLWPANTFSEDETTKVINIQDIVCTVNIVLDNEDGGAAEVRRFNSRSRGADRNLFFTDGRVLKVDALDSIAAFDLEIAGVNTNQVRLLLNANDWQMAMRQKANGVRLIVFSPTGATLPTGSNIQLLRLGADGTPTAVQATSIDATGVIAAVSGNAQTGISELSATELQASAGDGCIRLLSSATCGPTLIRIYNAQGILLSQHDLSELCAGQTVIGTGLPQAGGLIVMAVSNDEVGTKFFKLQMAK